MVTAMILSGGNGIRLDNERPKQYIEVGGKPVIMYCLDTMERQPEVDEVLVVAQKHWMPEIRRWIEAAGLRKFAGFAEGGASRENSIYNGLRLMKARGARDDDLVIVHDAARPCVTAEILSACVRALREGADAVLPGLAMRDTMYWSDDGQRIEGLVDRSRLVAGQTPECFRFGRFFRAHANLNDEEIRNIHGAAEFAFRNGIEVRFVPGSEANFKITVLDDLRRFQELMGERAEAK